MAVGSRSNVSTGTPEQAGAVAFGTIVGTQLAQTLEIGWSEGNLDRSVLAAVGGSTAFLFSTLTLGPLRNLLGLAGPTPLGWALIGTGALAAVALSRALAAVSLQNSPRPLLADPSGQRHLKAAPASPLLLPSA